jgi:hypothetical protein
MLEMSELGFSSVWKTTKPREGKERLRLKH